MTLVGPFLNKMNTKFDLNIGQKIQKVFHKLQAKIVQSVVKLVKISGGDFKGAQSEADKAMEQTANKLGTAAGEEAEEGNASNAEEEIQNDVTNFSEQEEGDDN